MTVLCAASAWRARLKSAEMALFANLIILIVFCTKDAICVTKSPEEEKEIKEIKEARELESALFTNYSAKFRPAIVQSQKTVVFAGLYMRDLNDVDENQHTVTVHGGIHMFWNDYRLQWDTSKFKPLYLSTSPWRVWKPDLTVWNSFEPSGGLISNFLTAPYTNNQAWIYNDGTISYYSSLSKTITCVFDYTKFPFDTQKCQLILGSWMFDYGQLDLQWSKARQLQVNFQWLGSPTNRTRTSGWRVLDIKLSRKFFYQFDEYTFLDDPPPMGYEQSYLWPILLAEFTLERHRPYFVLLELIPMILTSFLTLITFGIDSEIVAIGVLFANVVAQGLISWSIVNDLPTGTGGVPRIVHAYGLCLGLTCTSLLLHIVLQLVRTLDKSSPVVLLITRITSNPWTTGLQAVNALKINSFGTDYQEIIELTNELKSVNGINIEEKINHAIWVIKKVLFIVLTLCFLIAFPACLF